MKTVGKMCKACSGEYPPITYKNYEFLSQFLTSKGMIKSGKAANLCRKHHHRLSISIKRARVLGLLPFTTISYSIHPSDLVKIFEQDEESTARGEEAPNIEGEEGQGQ